ncbi:SspB family protein [Lichenihabitans psoromatis]|uniref:SspB family protein n=1 Tax=Lichenihabitans psoromatis TaxID=2528642 RepID=UPI001038572E|nr:ClpXP protease specificity-enhancing factor SspB [Lichenihabitans psoromatis]
MAADLIRYDLLVQEALRGVVRNVLTEAARNGLQGEHHFFITFKTSAPGLRLSNRMRERYPDEMTIILQHQFWDLGVTEHAFEVGLSFSNVPERLLIPFAAITSFVDPSVQFGLKFDIQDPAQASVSSGPEAIDKPSSTVETLKTAPNKRMLATVEPAGLPATTKPLAAVPSATSIKPDGKPENKTAKLSLSKVTTESDDEALPKQDDQQQAAKVVSIDSFRKKP